MKKTKTMKSLFIIGLFAMSLVASVASISAAIYAENNSTMTFEATEAFAPLVFTGSVSVSTDSTQHSFSVSSTAIKIQVSLSFSSSYDFDLSLWDNLNRRTGGWTAADHSQKSNIPNDSYSGYSTNPETITIDPPATSGTWKVGCYSYQGSGTYTITVTITEGGSTPGDDEITSGVPVTGSLGSVGETDMWFIDVDSDCTEMEAILTCGSADFDLYGRLNAEPTTSTYAWRGYTSGGEEVTYSNPGAGRWYIMVRDYSGSGSYQLTVTLTYGGSSPNGEKIAVFFWATDAGTQTVINNYKSYLQDEGYTKFFDFKDSTNVASDCQTVDSYEDSSDTIFVYIIGHGNNNGAHSYTAFRPSGSYVYSNTFRSYMDAWEAPQKAILVESCHSGDWADDFAASPYLAMSTSDETHNSYAYSTLPGEGKFSYYFFYRVRQGYNAVDSFNFAKSYCSSPVQNPKIRDYSTYVWFVN